MDPNFQTHASSPPVLCKAWLIDSSGEISHYWGGNLDNLRIGFPYVNDDQRWGIVDASEALILGSVTPYLLTNPSDLTIDRYTFSIIRHI